MELFLTIMVPFAIGYAIGRVHGKLAATRRDTERFNPRDYE